MGNSETQAIEHLRSAMDSRDKPEIDHWTVVSKGKDGKDLKFSLESTLHKIQMNGRPWHFNAFQHLGWWKRKYGIYCLEDGMIRLMIDGMDTIVFPQPNPVENLIFTE